MRAGRVISMIFALQQHGRMTAGDLAAQLEVSIRTILRDVETLSEAGVPIFTVPGAGGGIDLLDGFRTSLSGFTAEEGAALFLAGDQAGYITGQTIVVDGGQVLAESQASLAGI